ncbi:MAG: endo-1,4-beta-xylanase [Candidatus Helarchaeota archaeon]
MTFYKKLSKQGKVGFFIFLIVNVSFGFLLFSPYIPNFIGAFRDNQLLAGCDERIHQYRMGPVFIQLQNQTTGLPLTNWNLSYQLVKHEFVFGCNCYNMDEYNETGYNESYRNYFNQLFILAVVPFYWNAYEPEQNSFPTEAFKVNHTRDWGLQNNITLKGHPLLWSREYTYPGWLPLENDTAMLELMETRVRTIVSKYTGQIEYWDVVNEPIHTEPFAHLDRADYVYNALVWANETNPTARLIVNDYGIIGHDFGNGPFYRLLNDLIARNAPLDIIGLQSHDGGIHADWIPATEIWRSLNAYGQLGKPLHITEFIATSAPVPITNSWKKGMWSEDNQAEYASRFYKLCFSHPAVKGIIWWDLCDLNSWVSEGGLLNSSMGPKPVYYALDQLINHEWHTTGSQLTNASGWIDFTGFYGIYNISLPNGKSQLINVGSGALNNFVLKS